MSHRLLPSTLFAVGLVSVCNVAGSAVMRRDVKLPATKRVNIESLLAMGKSVALSQCEIPDLEMIPSLGPVTAQKIFENRDELMSRARGLKEPSLALLTIKGIGPATAEKIAPWLLIK